jgi:hypothetical protein
MTEMAFEWHLKKDDAILQGLYVGSYSKGVTVVVYPHPQMGLVNNSPENFQKAKNFPYS